MALLGLSFCARAFSSCGKRGPLFITVRGPLTIAWVPAFLPISPADSVTPSNLRTSGAKEGGRKYTQDLGHYRYCHWPPRWRKGNKIDYIIFIIWNEEGYQFFRVDRHLHGTNFWKKAISCCSLLQRTLNNIMDNLGAGEIRCIPKGGLLCQSPQQLWPTLGTPGPLCSRTCSPSDAILFCNQPVGGASPGGRVG